MLLIKDQILLKSKKDVIMVHLYIKCLQYNVILSDGVRELLYYVYDNNGIESIKDFNSLAKLCLENTSIKTKDSVRNTLSKCVSMNILENKGKYNKQISKDWLPQETNDNIGLEYKITNVFTTNAN